MKNYCKIYEHLGDALSKEIFGYRVLYTETGDLSWLSNVLLRNTWKVIDSCR